MHSLVDSQKIKKAFFMKASSNLLSSTLSLTMGLLLAGSALAQTVYTPKGTAVPANSYTEFSPAQIASANSNAAAQFPNAQRLADASATYNCHAYAWYLSAEAPGSPRYWINTPGNFKYWQDGSYIQICQQEEAAKIAYASDDHSAIHAPLANKFDSKWGSWPLMRHDPTYTPYNSSALNFYLPTKIMASSLTVSCNTTFSVPPFTGGGYSWRSSSNIALSGTTTASVTATSAGSGSGWVEVTITSPCSSTAVTSRLDVNVGYVVNGPSILCAGQSATYSVAGLPAGVNPAWSSSNPSYATIDPNTGVATPVGSNTASVVFTASLPAIGGCTPPPATKTVRAGSPGLVLVGSYTNASTGVVTTLANGSNPIVPRGTYYVDITPLTAQSYAPTTATVNPWIFGDAGSAGAYNLNNNRRGVISLTGYTGASVNISAVDACGSTAGFYFRLSPAASFAITASPNPATSVLTVESDLNESAGAQRQASEQPVFTAKLYNSLGTVVKAQASAGGKLQLDTRSLPAGLYTLRVGSGATTIAKHIEITH